TRWPRDWSSDVCSSDLVGFSANITWRFTVDTMAPSLSVTSPDYALTRNATTTVSGTTEVGATVTVNGATTGVNATTGAFSRTIRSEERRVGKEWRGRGV